MIVGGKIPVVNANTQADISIAQAAPIMCPSMLFVELICNRWASFPKTDFNATVSIESL